MRSPALALALCLLAHEARADEVAEIEPLQQPDTTDPCLLGVRRGVLLDDNGEGRQVFGGIWLCTQGAIAHSQMVERLKAENKELKVAPALISPWFYIGPLAVGVLGGFALAFIIKR